MVIWNWDPFVDSASLLFSDRIVASDSIIQDPFAESRYSKVVYRHAVNFSKSANLAKAEQGS